MSKKYYDDLLFKNTAEFYDNRFPYSKNLYKHIYIDYVKKHKYETLLDLGCGTGELSLNLNKYFSKVYSMDPENEMLDILKSKLNRRNINNIEIINGSSWDTEKLPNNIDLVIIGEAFHWMNREETLENLYDLQNINGVLITVSRKIIGPNGYDDIVKRTINNYLGKHRKAGKSTYEHPKKRHEEVLKESRYKYIGEWKYNDNHTKTIEEVINFLYSTSYANKRVLGRNASAFESDLNNSLRNNFGDTIDFEVQSSTIEVIKELKNQY